MNQPNYGKRAGDREAKSMQSINFHRNYDAFGQILVSWFNLHHQFVWSFVVVDINFEASHSAVSLIHCITRWPHCEHFGKKTEFCIFEISSPSNLNFILMIKAGKDCSQHNSSVSIGRLVIAMLTLNISSLCIFLKSTTFELNDRIQTESQINTFSIPRM